MSSASRSSRSTHAPRRKAFRRGAWVDLELRDADDTPVEGLIVDGFGGVDQHLVSEVVLPEVVDGDYTLHARVQTRFESRDLELELPLYTPAGV